MSDTIKLPADFSQHSKQEWLAKVQQDLKGKPLEELHWSIQQELELAPFYHPDDAITASSFPRHHAEQNHWLIGEDFRVEDAIATNKRLLAALGNGVNAPKLIFSALPTDEVLQDVFSGVELAYIHTYLAIDKPAEQNELLTRFLSYVEHRNLDRQKIHGGIDLANSPERVKKTAIAGLPNFQVNSVDGRQLSVAPEEVLDVLAELLLGLDGFCQQSAENSGSPLRLQIAVGKSYFLEIAKIRALRLLWANLLEAYGLQQDWPLLIDTYISKSAFDDNRNNNMIRSMTMALSAVIGGIDRLTVHPSDPEDLDFTTRIARNVQHLLQHESYLDRVIDPAKGSYYIEVLTRQLVEKTWETLQFPKDK